MMGLAIIVLAMSMAPAHSYAIDLSSLDITAHTFNTKTGVQLLITDPLGRQTGFRSINGQNIQDIPKSNYFIESIDNDVTIERGNEVVIFGQDMPSIGTYTITVLGLASSKYNLSLKAADLMGHPIALGYDTFQNYISTGASQQYNLQYDPTPGAPAPVITKTVTFDVLRQELQTAFQLKQTGDDKFVAKLDKILKQGQLAINHKKDNERENKKEAVEKLREFIARLEKAARQETDEDDDRGDRSKSAKSEKYEDKRRHETKRFVTAEALKILKSDAEILIKVLGGNPEKDRHEKNDK